MSSQVSWLINLDDKLMIRAAKFGGMTCLTIYIPGSTSDGEEETTKVFYIGLRGSWSAVSWLERKVTRLS